MKIRHILTLVAVLVFGVSLANAATARLTVNAGDTAYVCQCAAKCCETVALKPAKCGCGKDLTKVSVTRVKGKKAYYQADGKEQSFKLTGKYGCACGGDCCMLVSDKPGKCCCGKELAKGGKSA